MARKPAKSERTEVTKSTPKRKPAGIGKTKLTVAQRAAEAKESGGRKAATDKLAPIAFQINKRLERAEKIEDDAYDHRLACALLFADAAAIIKQTRGLSFKTWAAENVPKFSYKTVNNLLLVGRASNPQLALEDLRAKSRLRASTSQKRHAEEHAAALAKIPKIQGAKTKAAATLPHATPATRVLDALAVMQESEARNLFESTAGNYGLAICTQEQKEILQASASVRIASLFKGLGGSQQMKILKKLASSVGVKLDTSVGDISGNGGDASDASDVPDVSDPFDIPDNLQRTEKKKGRSRRKNVSSSPVSE